jgi:hypothetical protein
MHTLGELLVGCGVLVNFLGSLYFIFTLGKKGIEPNEDGPGTVKAPVKVRLTELNNGTQDEDTVAGVNFRTRDPVSGCSKLMGSIFYLLLCVQVGIGMWSFTAKNVVYVDMPPDYDPEAVVCPAGFVQYGWMMNQCISDDLMQEYAACEGRRMQEYEDCLQSDSDYNCGERFLQVQTQNNLNVWTAMAEYVHIPIVLFGAMIIIVPLWLLMLQKQTAGMVWGTLVIDCLAILYMWYLADFAPALLVLLAGFVGCVYVFRKHIQTAISVMKMACNALADCPTIFVLSAFVFWLYATYVVLWILALLTLPNVRGAKPPNPDHPDAQWHSCELEMAAGAATGLHWLATLFVPTTFFFNNARMAIAATGVGSWYFDQDDPSRPKNPSAVGLRWAFFESSGANFSAACVMYAVHRLRAFANSKLNLCLYPGVGCVIYVLWMCVETCLQAFTKFLFIAHIFHGGQLVKTGKMAWFVLKKHLGDAVISDGIAKNVVACGTIVISTGLAFAGMAWTDAEIDGDGVTTWAVDSPGAFLAFLVVLLWCVTHPLFSIVVLCGLLGDYITDARIVGLMVGIFIGSVSFICFSFAANVVHNACDVAMYCYALEAEAGKSQERFQATYETMKKSVAVGVQMDAANVAMGKEVPDETGKGKGADETHEIEKGNEVEQAGGVEEAKA